MTVAERAEINVAVSIKVRCDKVAPEAEALMRCEMEMANPVKAKGVPHAGFLRFPQNSREIRRHNRPPSSNDDSNDPTRTPDMLPKFNVGDNVRRVDLSISWPTCIVNSPQTGDGVIAVLYAE